MSCRGTRARALSLARPRDLDIETCAYLFSPFYSDYHTHERQWKALEAFAVSSSTQLNNLWKLLVALTPLRSFDWLSWDATNGMVMLSDSDSDPLRMGARVRYSTSAHYNHCRKVILFERSDGRLALEISRRTSLSRAGDRRPISEDNVWQSYLSNRRQQKAGEPLQNLYKNRSKS